MQRHRHSGGRIATDVCSRSYGFLTEKFFSRLSSRGVDHVLNLTDLVAWEPAPGSVLTNRFNIICNVDAEKFVISNVTLNPLCASGHSIKGLNRLLGNGLKLGSAQETGSKKLPFNDIFGHNDSPHHFPPADPVVCDEYPRTVKKEAMTATPYLLTQTPR